MNHSDSNPPRDCSVDDQAADWVVRHERGLTPGEQDEFSAWLAADARHPRAYAEQRWSWEELDRLTGLQTTTEAVPDPTLLARRARPGTRVERIAAWSLATAAMAVIGFYFLRAPRENENAAARSALLTLCEKQTLADGSVVELNRGAAIRVRFTPETRHVTLERGEAHFAVAKDPARPFVVEASRVAVRAVGTEFSVSVGQSAITVLVTEGRVQVASPEAGATAPGPVVDAGQRAVVSLLRPASAAAVAPVTPAEIEDQLAWKPRLLNFDEVTLGEIADEFNRRNPVKLTIADPALRARRLSATIRSDNVEGFVKLLQSDFGIRAEWPSATFIELRPAN